VYPVYQLVDPAIATPVSLAIIVICLIVAVVRAL
jgi:hypothetical protein